MPKLVFIGEHFAGRIYELVLEKTTIGRREGNTLVIHDSEISHVHCEILVYGGEVIVRDLGSSNGTFVDGVKINPQMQLKNGHVVRFGTAQARLVLEDEPSSDPTTDMTAVHEMGKFIRDQRREANTPKPSGAPVTIDPVEGNAAATHTMILTKDAPVLPRSPEPAKPVPAKTASRITIIITVILTIALVRVLIWLIWERK